MKRIILIILAAAAIIAGSVSCSKNPLENSFEEYEEYKYAPNNKIEGQYDKSLSAKCSNGTFVGRLEDGIKVFRGIPYAKQPVGDRRFQLPEAPDKNDGVYEAYHYAHSAMQPVTKDEKASLYEQGEDMLALNV